MQLFKIDNKERHPLRMSFFIVLNRMPLINDRIFVNRYGFVDKKDIDNYNS